MKKRGKVFISYRRDGGAELARNIRDALQKRRFDVFMDVEDLRGGSFNKALFGQIEAATDVVAILTPGSLDRCFDDPNDWLRLELAHALKRQKNVVPVLHRGFQWPDRKLPGDLSTLTEQSGLPSSHDFFEASMDRLAEKLLVGWAPRPVARTRLLILAVSVCLVAAAALGLIWMQDTGDPDVQSFSPPTATAAARLGEDLDGPARSVACKLAFVLGHERPNKWSPAERSYVFADETLSQLEAGDRRALTPAFQEARRYFTEVARDGFQSVDTTYQGHAEEALKTFCLQKRFPECRGLTAKTAEELSRTSPGDWLNLKSALADCGDRFWNQQGHKS
jgi:TIR domain-containing protein